MTQVLVVAAFVAAYVLIATERIHRVAAALSGAAAMVLLGVVDARVAFFSEKTGVFDYVAIWAAKRTRGRPFATMVMLVVITAIASALLDNVTTVLLIAPVTLLVCDRLGLAPVPFLIAEALASNIGGTATLIGDPPNIIIASRGGLTFNDFLFNLAPVVILLMVVFIGLCRVLFRSAFTYDPERVAALMALEEHEVIKDRPLLIRSGIVLFAVMVGFIAHGALHLEPSMVALLGAGALVALSKLDAPKFLEEVEWPTLVFFMGLFVMVGALVEVGIIGRLGTLLTEAVGDRYLLASSVLLGGSALLSGIVDNIPYVATVAPLVQTMVDAGHGAGHATALWWALALGADLGGNATAVGASANVVVIGIAARARHPITFWRFTRYGAVVAAVTIAVSWLYLYLRFYAFG